MFLNMIDMNIWKMVDSKSLVHNNVLLTLTLIMTALSFVQSA